MARPRGAKALRSMLGIQKLDDLNVDPIEGALSCIKELDEIIAMNIRSFKEFRGYGEKNDAGTDYLRNAISAVGEKRAIYLGLAQFKYAKLSAIAVQNMGGDDNGPREVATHQEAIDILKADPLIPHDESAKLDAIARKVNNKTEPVYQEALPIGGRKKYD